MVKLTKRSPASLSLKSRKRLLKALAKRHAVRFGLSLMARRECRTAGVESGPKSSLVRIAEHGNAAHLARPHGRADLTARRVRRGLLWEDRRSQGSRVIRGICPRRSGLTWHVGEWNRFVREKQMTTDARRLMRLAAGALKEPSVNGLTPVLPSPPAFARGGGIAPTGGSLGQT